MIRLLDRYVFRELTAPFLLGVGLFTFFLTIDRVYQLTDLVVTKGVPFHLVLQLLVRRLPGHISHHCRSRHLLGSRLAWKHATTTTRSPMTR